MRPFSILFGAAVLAAGALLPAQSQEVRGQVFLDADGDGLAGAGEAGVADVVVSTRRHVTRTNAEGRYRLPIGGDDWVFVVKPSGLRAERWYRLHKPNGSPKQHYAGVAPTGPLPESVDFALRPAEEEGTFRVALLADPQPETPQEVDYIRRDVLADVALSGARFGITLGDIMYDRLELFEPYNAAIAATGIPFHHVIGNHDLNFDAATDATSSETFQRHYGPTDYAFNVGKVHFVVLDNIRWDGPGKGDGNYTERVEPEQVAWVKEVLATVPAEFLVVLCTHAPLRTANRAEGRQLTGNFALLAEALRERRRILAVNGHTHINNHYWFTKADGWEGAGEFHQINVPVVSGSWWSGPKDVRGIPTTEQRDGSPNGYYLLDFEGANYTPSFRPAALPATHQMRIHPPGTHSAGQPRADLLLVNVFDAPPDARVEWSVDGLSWKPMTAKPQLDPTAEALYSGALDSGKSFVNPIISYHMWEAAVDPLPAKGSTVLLRVRSEDRFGRRFEGATFWTR